MKSVYTLRIAYIYKRNNYVMRIFFQNSSMQSCDIEK